MIGLYCTYTHTHQGSYNTTLAKMARGIEVVGNHLDLTSEAGKPIAARIQAIKELYTKDFPVSPVKSTAPQGMVVEVVPDIGGDPAKAVEMSVLLETTISSEEEYQVMLKEWEEQNDTDKQKVTLGFITDRLHFIVDDKS